MFQKVASAYPVSCQNSPDTFKKIRESLFQEWPQRILSAYLRELGAAEAAGRNLLTEKYARMDGLIPSINTNPLIKKIVNIEERWQAELKETYPALYQQTCRDNGSTGDGSCFSIYLSCELETYGDEVIVLYYAWVSEAVTRQENISLKMLETLVCKGGFQDISHAENYFMKKSHIVHEIGNGLDPALNNTLGRA